MSLNPLPAARIRDTVWTGNVYEPSDDSFTLVDALLADLVSSFWTDQVP